MCFSLLVIQQGNIGGLFDDIEEQEQLEEEEEEEEGELMEKVEEMPSFPALDETQITVIFINQQVCLCNTCLLLMCNTL